MSRDPFVIPEAELTPLATTPADAPPPDEEPQGEAMQQVTRLAARPRGGGLFWTVLGSLVFAAQALAGGSQLDKLVGQLAIARIQGGLGSLLGRLPLVSFSFVRCLIPLNLLPARLINHLRLQARAMPPAASFPTRIGKP